MFVGLVFMILLYLYRRRWLRRLRDKLAEDGITASEVVWFTKNCPRLNVKHCWRSANTAHCSLMLSVNPGQSIDGKSYYQEDQHRARKIRSRINRARTLKGADTSDLLVDLDSDQQQLQMLNSEANVRLVEAKARLQTIEAAAGRSLNQAETHAMLRRLSATQEHLPLVIEMDRLERKTLKEAERDLKERETSLETPEDPGMSRN